MNYNSWDEYPNCKWMNNGWVTPLDTLSCRTCPTRPSFCIVMNISTVTAQNHLALHCNELHKNILDCNNNAQLSSFLHCTAQTAPKQCISKPNILMKQKT